MLCAPGLQQGSPAYTACISQSVPHNALGTQIVPTHAWRSGSPANKQGGTRLQLPRSLPGPRSMPGPTLRRSWEISQPGAVSRLLLKEQPMPALRPGQATVQVHSIGLNMADLFSVLGLYAAFRASECNTPGLEFAGKITAVDYGDATECSTLKVGDRVVGISKFGAFSTHVNLELRYLRRFPESWSLAQAAAFPVQALTALYGLQTLGALKPNACLLIHSAAGGVGLAALKIAQRFNCTVLGTVGSPSKVQLLRDQFGPGSLKNAAGVVGTVVGFLRRPKLDLLQLPGQNKGVLGFNLIFLYENIDMFEELYKALEALQLDAPLVGKTYKFEELPQALEYLQSGQSVGKVVVRVQH